MEDERLAEEPCYGAFTIPRYSRGGRGQYGNPTHTRKTVAESIRKRTVIESAGSVVADLATADRESHWLWQGTSQGRVGCRHGVIRMSNDRHYVHRVAYGLFREHCHPEYTLYRDCDRELCINPLHHRLVLNGYWLRGEDYAERLTEKYAPHLRRSDNLCTSYIGEG